jgi:hypothetical protein
MYIVYRKPFDNAARRYLKSEKREEGHRNLKEGANHRT